VKTVETRLMRRVSIPVDAGYARGAQQTVLVVTEDADLREACSRAVASAGYRVVAAAHSGHALLAGLSGDPIDIILTELAMGEVSGPGLADRLRKHHPALRAAYFANAGTPECEGILVRPFTRDEVLDQLSALGA
jgi:CheY-like chemotaxis protein